MRSLRMFFAGLVTAFGLAFAGPAFAGGWDYDEGGYYGYGTVYVHHHVYAPPRYVHVYHVHRPSPRHVHVIGYEHPGYRAYAAYPSYAHGIYWRQPFYRAYYPVRTVYPYRHTYRRAHPMK